MYILPALLSKCRMPATAPPDSGDKPIFKKVLPRGEGLRQLREARQGWWDRPLAHFLFAWFHPSPAPSMVDSNIWLDCK